MEEYDFLETRSHEDIDIPSDKINALKEFLEDQVRINPEQESLCEGIIDDLLCIADSIFDPKTCSIASIKLHAAVTKCLKIRDSTPEQVQESEHYKHLQKLPFSMIVEIQILLDLGQCFNEILIEDLDFAYKYNEILQCTSARFTLPPDFSEHRIASREATFERFIEDQSIILLRREILADKDPVIKNIKKAHEGLGAIKKILKALNEIFNQNNPGEEAGTLDEIIDAISKVDRA